MSIALAVYYLSRRLEGVQAFPVLNVEGSTMPACDNINNCRTTSDIVWSCLTTVFTCTWVAIHPNIPAPYESTFEINLKRFGIVLMALIAPELVIMWAMRQWLVSRRLAREHQPHRWTQTHGFFALMGGFMLVDGDGKELYTLLPERLDKLSKEGKIMFPKITKKEIEDRSKGDVISKGFVMVQTGWFVLQCIARGVEHLPITELELASLAFAVLNLVTYALWWNKPQNVQCPFPVHFLDGNSLRRNGNGNDEIDEGHGVSERARRAIRDIWEDFANLKAARGLIALIYPFIHMGWSSKHEEKRMVDRKKVSSFYAGEDKSEPWFAGFAGAAVAVVFGAIHCIAWSFQFPSQEKEILWRTCSVAITCLPAPMVFVGLMFVYVDESKLRGRIDLAVILLALFMFVILFFAVILPIIYIVSRAILLVEAFILLKSLPLGAFRTVQWTTFIPHV